MHIVRESKRSRKGRVVCILFSVLFIAILLCFSFTRKFTVIKKSDTRCNISVQISDELTENSGSDDFLDPDADKL